MSIHSSAGENLTKAEESFYLEACEEQASNKTNVDGLLVFARRLDQLLNSSVVLL